MYVESDLLNIQVISQITGLNTHTIRAWEKRYQVVVPKRDERGRRLYSSDEVTKLRLLKALVEKGNSISELAKRDFYNLEELYSKLYGEVFNANNIEFINQSTLDIKETYKHILFAIQNFNITILAHEIQKAKNALNTKSFLEHIISPLLKEVLNIKLKGNLTHFQKDMIALTIKMPLESKLFTSLNNNHLDPYRPILASPMGKLNELSLIQTSILLSTENIAFNYLGPNLNEETLAEFAKQLKSKILILALGHSPTMDKEDQIKYLKKLDELLPEDINVWITGDMDYCPFISSKGYQCFEDLNLIVNRLKY